MNVTPIAGDAECDREVRSIMNSDQPEFLARIGGSDTSAAVFLKDVPPSDRKEILAHKPILAAYNGFYDFETEVEGVLRFASVLTQCYRSCDTMIAGANLVAVYFPERIEMSAARFQPERLRPFREYVDALPSPGSELRLMPIDFAARLVCGEHTLFRSLAGVLAGKKVLVITPFSESIKTQFPNRHLLFRDYRYPEFELLTYTTPITYAGLERDAYPDRDWFTTTERMCHELEKLDFDVALLACGSYAMPLGCFIRDVCKRKAVYVGGILQMFFGLIGRRFETPFYLNQINSGAFMRPVEGRNFAAKVEVPTGSETEAFGAYF